MDGSKHIKNIVFHYPRHLVWGNGSLMHMAENILEKGLKRLYILTIPFVLKDIAHILELLQSKGITLKINTQIEGEPTFEDAGKILSEAREFKADGVAGIGGGSVMDVAKLVAALIDSEQELSSLVGIGLLKRRNTYLVCVPTTSGTGSEVSPNSILLDTTEGLKKGIISPFLVPDGVYIDPELTLGLPPDLTASTGMDALTHCIEGHANKCAHPMVDILALEGIRLISGYLKKAVNNGKDIEARSKLSMGSVYGGMCLGPVNTAAVHALAYPLGSEFKVAHGLSNALLLPYVMEYNISAAADRYAEIAVALGCEKGTSPLETALKGVDYIKQLIKECNLPLQLSAVGIPVEAIDKMARSAFSIQRLLKNNVREMNLEDIIEVYRKAC